MDPKVISLDIETYGVLRNGPDQTVFHPMRSIHTDGVDPSRLIVTVSITIPEIDPRCQTRPNSTTSLIPPSLPLSPPSPQSLPFDSPPTPSSDKKLGMSTPVSELTERLLPEQFVQRHGWPSSLAACGSGWDRQRIASLRPAHTLVLVMSNPQHREVLRAWLRHSDTLIGMNLPFDLMYLRTQRDFRYLLDGKHTILDLSYINYLESEARPERTLKSIGPVLGTHIYSRTAADKFLSEDDPALHHYNGEDTWNTLLAVSELAARMPTDSWKLSPFCVQFYSDTFWSCLRMAEAGVPISIPRLERLKAHLLWRSNRLQSRLMTTHNLQISGKGSHTASNPTSIPAFLDRVIEACPPGTRSNRLLEFTEKTKQICFSEENRNLLISLLPPAHPFREALTDVGSYVYFEKLLSDYVWPLLYHKRKDETEKKSVLIPLPPDNQIGIGYPTWYPVPTHPKDSEGREGGTIQGRITCKDPKKQTFPPLIKDCEASRFGREGEILSMDLSQIELRVAALLSGDEVMCTEYNKPSPDLHTDMAVRCYGAPLLIQKYGEKFAKNKVFKKQERQDGKQLNFAHLFRAKPPRMQRTILETRGILLPLPFFEKIADNRYRDRPGLVEWQYRMCVEAETTGKITLPFTGQSRSFPAFRLDHPLWLRSHQLEPITAGGGRNGDSAKSPISEIVNFPVQTTAGNLLLRITAHLDLPNLNAPRAPVFVYGNVYDALYFDVKKVYRKTLEEKIARACDIVATQDYWWLLQQLLGRTVPLAYEVTTHG